MSFKSCQRLWMGSKAALVLTWNSGCFSLLAGSAQISLSNAGGGGVLLSNSDFSTAFPTASMLYCLKELPFSFLERNMEVNYTNSLELFQLCYFFLCWMALLAMQQLLPTSPWFVFLQNSGNVFCRFLLSENFFFFFLQRTLSLLDFKLGRLLLTISYVLVLRTF